MQALTDSLKRNFGRGFISFTQLYERVVSELGSSLSPQEVRNIFENEVAPKEDIFYDEKFRTYKRREK